MKKIIAMLLALVMALSLVACGGSEPAETKPAADAPAAEAPATEAAPEAITLKVWAPQEDQGDDTKWLNQMLVKFEEAHPEYEITWDLGVCGEGDAGNNVKTDPTAAGDVYMFANDQIGTLVQAGALSKLGGAYLEQVQNDNSQTLLDTVTYSDGSVYGFPMTNNTWFMYYNTDIFTAEDVKSLDAMLAKGKVAFQWGTGWYNGTFFFANGGKLYGDAGNDAAQGVTFGGEAGYAAAAKMVECFATGNMVDDKNGSGVSAFKAGEVGAIFTGSWDFAGLKEALGDKLAATQLPTTTINGQEAQLKSFAGSKCVGVNPNAKFPKAAMQLAAFLASEEAQLARYEIRGIIPSHKNLSTNEAITSNIVAVAEMNTMNNTSVAQPIIPEMGNFWTPMGTFGGAITTGEVNADNVQEQVDLLNDQLNGNGGL